MYNRLSSFIILFLAVLPLIFLPQSPMKNIVSYVKENLERLEFEDMDKLKAAMDVVRVEYSNDEDSQYVYIAGSSTLVCLRLIETLDWDNLMFDISKTSSEYDLILHLLAGLISGMDQEEIEAIFFAKLQRLRFENSDLWKAFAGKKAHLARMKRLAKRPHQ